MEYKDVNDFEVLYMIKEKDDYYQELMYKKYSPISTAIAERSNIIVCFLSKFSGLTLALPQ